MLYGIGTDVQKRINIYISLFSFVFLSLCVSIFPSRPREESGIIIRTKYENKNICEIIYKRSNMW